MPETVARVLDLSVIVCYTHLVQPRDASRAMLVILAEKRWLADLPSWILLGFEGVEGYLASTELVKLGEPPANQLKQINSGLAPLVARPA